MQLLQVSLLILFSIQSIQSKVLITANAPIGLPKATPAEVASLPDHFDARNHWPECADILGHVSTQGNCGSCWAVAAAEHLSDRFCIASRGQIKVQLSVWNLLECCGLGVCADGIQDFGGCAGGDPYPTLKYIAENGITTEKCKPNPTWLRSYGINALETQCKQACDNPNLSYQESLYYASSYYRLPNDEATIRHEILTHGPVMAHADHRTWGSKDRYFNWNKAFTCGPKAKPVHSVRLIGWGTDEDGVPYWLAVNSWGRSWGVDGTLKIARGNNTCFVESMVTAALPKL